MLVPASWNNTFLAASVVLAYLANAAKAGAGAAAAVNETWLAN